MASILYYAGNIALEYLKRKKFEKKRVRKGIELFLKGIFIFVSMWGIILIVKQGVALILEAGIWYTFQKVLWIVIIVLVVMGGYFYGTRKKKRNIAEILQLTSYIIFLLYLPFTYNENIESAQDVFKIEDFVENNKIQKENYDTVFRVQDTGLFGTVKKVLYTGREERIAQKNQFKYAIYSVRNEKIRQGIKKQYLE